MTGFDEREKGFEAKYRQDQEAQFKVKALRNKLLGLWAADLIKPLLLPTLSAIIPPIILSSYKV